MNPIDSLRLKKNPPPTKPPQGQLDLLYSPEAGGVVVRDSSGTDTPVGGGGGATAGSVLDAMEDFDAAQAADARAALGVDRVIYASHTLASDADLSKGSATFGTDQTANAQAILDHAEDGPILVIWDVAISCTGLRIRGNTHIQAKPGCGAILRDGSDKPLLGNYNPTASTIQDENITIEGGIWNGNGANQEHDTVEEGWIVGLRFMGVRGLTLRGLTIYDASTFAFHAANWERVVCEDIFIDNHDGTYNHDGLHFIGPGRYASVRNLVAFVDDDALAFNANDGTSQSDGAGTSYGPYAGPGDITDVFVDGVTLMGGHSGVRLLSSTNLIDRVQIRNLTGSATYQAILIDSYSEGNWRIGPPGFGNVGSVLIDGVDVVLAGSGYKQCLIWVQTNIAQLRLKNVTRTDFGFNLPTLKIGADANIEQLVLEGWASLPSTLTNNSYASGQITNAGRIGSMQVVGCNFARPDGAASGSPIVNSGTIRQFQAIGTQASGWASLTANTGTISTDNSASSNNDALTQHWTIESGFGTQTPYNIGSLILTPPSTDPKVAYITTSDAFSGNVLASALFDKFQNNIITTLVIARGSSLAPWSGATCYCGGVNNDGSVAITKMTAGSGATMASLAAALGIITDPHRIILTTKDSGPNVVVTLYVQRVSDGYFLNPSKVFVAPTEAGTYVLQATDSSSVISGAGKVGLIQYAGSGGQTVNVSEFMIQAAP